MLINPQDRSQQAELKPSDQVYLVNLKDDLGETKNVASEHPELVQELMARIDEIRADWE